MITQSNLRSTWQYIQRDYHSDPARFWLEVVAWVLSIGGAVLFALTVPAVPFIFYLLVVISGSAIYTWAAWTRGSVGMLANYLLLTTIDTVGLIRLVF